MFCQVKLPKGIALIPTAIPTKRYVNVEVPQNHPSFPWGSCGAALE